MYVKVKLDVADSLHCQSVGTTTCYTYICYFGARLSNTAIGADVV